MNKQDLANLRVVDGKYTLNGIEYTAQPVSEQEARAENVSLDCECGMEMCVSGWRWRCMAGGGGTCVWYQTNEVC